MSREEILAKVKDGLGSKVVNWFEKNPRRIYVEVKPADVPEATKLVHKDLGARFQIASGIDTPDALEIIYHWGFDSHDVVVNVVTKMDKKKPEVESVASICSGTEWIEREMNELLGITFKNHPDMRRLLLADDWPEGVYPLRRDFVVKPKNRKLNG